VRVSSDYDQNINFAEYKTYAFYKPGIDKAEISDLDKKRILRAIEKEMTAKGFTKSDNPTILVSIFAKANKRVSVYQNNRFGFGEGVLYIDLLDANKKQLVWQGKGTAPLTNKNIDKREERIQEIVQEIMTVYPPEVASN